ncbi:YeaH/YhbH family protein [Accumulibacter sp.]|uniref:YeaH/YhbH family protein n=1 Tax=Accumulibacter sp. TaxID=2053492 RepID=UPI002611C612|nr:YeaH/YhbH family protein [Accumulibacter sp.]
MQQIIDRRLAGKNKSIGNRERFLRRHQAQIREAVKRAIAGRAIRDIAQGEDIHIPRRDISEPVFGHAAGGRRETVHPGNRDFVRGDRIERPPGGGAGGGGAGQAGDSGQGEDDFVFHLSKEEFMQAFFDDLALPNLVRTTLADTPEYRTRRAGFSSDGTPNNLHVVRSMRGAIGRRIALGSESRRELARLEELLASYRAPAAPVLPAQEMAALERDIAALRARLQRIPYLDPIDLRYRSRVRMPVPTARAVMFCLMDVSGSMDEARKDLAKRFFILLYLFLTRHYERIDLVFIRHHTQAQEVNENEFFHATETGGTVVSSALVLMEEIVRARYPSSEWNIYGAQASDGDNWHSDSPRCRELLARDLLPLCRYFAYIQVVEEEQSLWQEYAALAATSAAFAMRKATTIDQIYPVFRDLFSQEIRAR